MRKKIGARPLLALMLFWLGLSGIPSQASERVYYFHNDHLGTPQAMSDAAGRTVWTAEYDPFGKAMVNQDPDGDGQVVVNNLRFPGQYYDAETGLHYNYHRDYDPATGRYLQPDPIGLVGGTNLYSYAMDNSIRYTDEYGLVTGVEETMLIGTVGGIIAAGGLKAYLQSPAGQQAVQSAIEIGQQINERLHNLILMAKGGWNNIDNEYVRDVQNQGKKCEDPCKYLRNLYQNERSPVERQKIKIAQKRFNCDGKDRFRIFPIIPNPAKKSTSYGPSGEGPFE